MLDNHAASNEGRTRYRSSLLLRHLILFAIKAANLKFNIIVKSDIFQSAFILKLLRISLFGTVLDLNLLYTFQGVFLFWSIYVCLIGFVYDSESTNVLIWMTYCILAIASLIA